MCMTDGLGMEFQLFSNCSISRSRGSSLWIILHFLIENLLFYKCPTMASYQIQNPVTGCTFFNMLFFPCRAIPEYGLRFLTVWGHSLAKEKRGSYHSIFFFKQMPQQQVHNQTEGCRKASKTSEGADTATNASHFKGLEMGHADWLSTFPKSPGVWKVGVWFIYSSGQPHRNAGQRLNWWELLKWNRAGGLRSRQ